MLPPMLPPPPPTTALPEPPPQIVIQQPAPQPEPAYRWWLETVVVPIVVAAIGSGSIAVIVTTYLRRTPAPSEDTQRTSESG